MEQVKIEVLIALLAKQLANGGKTVVVKGTLLIPENGNYVLLTSEPQM